MSENKRLQELVINLFFLTEFCLGCRSDSDALQKDGGKPDPTRQAG
jgi:hypothetical protein